MGRLWIYLVIMSVCHKQRLARAAVQVCNIRRHRPIVCIYMSVTWDKLLYNISKETLRGRKGGVGHHHHHRHHRHHHLNHLNHHHEHHHDH